MGRLLPGVVGISLLLLVGYGLSSQRPLESAPAPDLAMSLFDGGKLSLRELRGDVVVLNFWASWCAPCREEAPVLEKLWREYRAKGVSFVGVNIKDVSNNALAFVEQYGITYPNGPDPRGSIAGSYRVRKVPETFLISREGVIERRFVGAVVEQQLQASINELLER